jgi:hypothetical protein
MPRPRNEPLKLEQRRRKVATLYLRGRYQFEIAAELGVDGSTISRDLQAIRDQWRASSLRDFDGLKAKELDRIDALEREYWAAWDAHRRAGGRQADDGEVDPADADDHDDTEDADDHDDTGGTDGSAPSPKAAVFLAGVNKCIERRCKILGLDAPTKVAPTTPDGCNEYNGLTPDALRRLPLDELVRKYHQALGAPNPIAGKPQPPGP